MDAHVEWLSQFGYPGLCLLLAAGIFGLPVPDETLLTFAGYLVYRGDLKLLPVAAAAFFGSACGITLSYWLGRTLGLSVVLRLGRFVRLTPEKLDRAARWFDRAGKWTLLAGYFIPGVRHLTALAAGISRLPAREFALFAYAGALLWTQTFILLGFRLGKQWPQALKAVQRHRLAAVVVVAALILAFLAAKRFRSRRARESNEPARQARPRA